MDDDDDDFAKFFSTFDDDDFAEDKEAIEELIADYTEISSNLSPFDAIYHPAVLELCGCVVPFDITEDLRPTLVTLSELALKDYNQKNQGTSFVFDDLVKCTTAIGCGGGDLYYITFQAKAEEDPSNTHAITTFQAEVWDDEDDADEVISCAIKI